MTRTSAFVNPALSSRSVPRLWRALALACIALLGACAEVPESGGRAREQQLVFPGPPDEPRYYFERAIYSSADVVPDEEGADLRRLVTGEGKVGEGMIKPYAIAVHRGRIYVTDTVTRNVRVFDAAHGKYWRLGEDGAGQLFKPLGIDVGPDGKVYVVDGTAKAVMVYDADGKYITKFGGPETFERPAGVTVDNDGSRLFVVDIGGVTSTEHRVRVLDANTGRVLMDIGKRGSGPGEFNLPRDSAVGPDGMLYVVDGGNFRVQVFDRQGKFVREFGKVGRQFGDFARPKEIAVDSGGKVYVADAAFGNFQIFEPSGKLLMFIGGRSEADVPAGYVLPSGIAVDEDGRIYFVDQWYRKIEIFRPADIKADQGYLASGQPARLPVTR